MKLVVCQADAVVRLWCRTERRRTINHTTRTQGMFGPDPSSRAQISGGGGRVIVGVCCCYQYPCTAAGCLDFFLFFRGNTINECEKPAGRNFGNIKVCAEQVLRQKRKCMHGPVCVCVRLCVPVRFVHKPQHCSAA